MTIKRNHVIQRLDLTSSLTVVPAEPFLNIQANSVGAALAAGGIDDNQAQTCNSKISSDIIGNRGSCGTISA